MDIWRCCLIRFLVCPENHGKNWLYWLSLLGICQMSSHNMSPRLPFCVTIKTAHFTIVLFPGESFSHSWAAHDKNRKYRKKTVKPMYESFSKIYVYEWKTFFWTTVSTYSTTSRTNIPNPAVRQDLVRVSEKWWNRNRCPKERFPLVYWALSGCTFVSQSRITKVLIFA